MNYLWTTINVKNLDESIAFYERLTGLKMLRRFPAGPGVEIAFMGSGTDGETTVELLAEADRDNLTHGNSVALGFGADSIEAMLEAVKNAGIPVHSGPFETPKMRYFGILDPDGVHVQFFQMKQPA